MDDKKLVILIFLAIVNLIAFFMMQLDKSRSKKVGSERIPEGVLFFVAAAFGSPGILAGMIFFRHKTAKWYFCFGMPLIALQNGVSLYLIYGFSVKN